MVDFEKEDLVFCVDKRNTKIEENEKGVANHAEDELFFINKATGKEYKLIADYDCPLLTDEKEYLFFGIGNYYKIIGKFRVEERLDDNEENKEEIKTKIETWKKFFENRKDIFLNQSFDECWKYLLDFERGNYWTYGKEAILYQVNKDTYILEITGDYGGRKFWLSNK